MCALVVALAPKKMSLDVYMEFNDVFSWHAPKTCHLTCIWNLRTFSRDTPLKTSFDAYMELIKNQSHAPNIASSYCDY